MFICSFAQISQEMDNLVAEHPGLVSRVNIGSSFENRPMDVLKVQKETAVVLAFDASRTLPLPAGPAEWSFFPLFFFPSLLLTGPCWF
jgi:hypothetical protein